MEKSQPSFEQLVDWIEGKLSEEEASAISAEVAVGSDALQADVAWLRLFYQLSRHLQLSTPPAEMHHHLIQHFESYMQHRPQPFFFPRFEATLVFDSHDHLVLAGFRSAVQGQERQIIYSTSRVEIALNIQPRVRGERFDLIGQVFPLDEAANQPYTIQLLSEAHEQAIAATDHLGEFAFKALTSGIYNIILSSEQFEVLFPPMSLPA